MTSAVPEAVTSHTGDLPFNVLRWVSVAALTALAYMGAMDAIGRNWLAFATSAVLILLVAIAIVRPAFSLARSTVTVDARGIRRKGGWDLAWWDVARAEVKIHKDVQYLVVVPRTPPRAMDITRFFVRAEDFPKEAYVAPLDTHMAPEIKEAVRQFKRRRS